MLLRRAVERRADVESELVRQRCADLAADERIAQALGLATDLERGDALEIDRSELMAQDHGVLGLARMAPRKRNLTGVSRRARGDRANRGQAGTMERLVRDDQHATPPALLVADRRVEAGDHDGPAQWIGHSGHDSA